MYRSIYKPTSTFMCVTSKDASTETSALTHESAVVCVTRIPQASRCGCRSTIQHDTRIKKTGAHVTATYIAPNSVTHTAAYTASHTQKRTLQRTVHGTLHRTVQCALQRTPHHTLRRTLQRTLWCSLIERKMAYKLLVYMYMSNNHDARLRTAYAYEL